MAFHLEQGPVGRQLHRLTRTQLDAAIDALDRRADGVRIHDARKRIKKVRSILTLLRESLGRAHASEDARLRAASRTLSSLRDADAMIQTVEDLATRYSAELGETARRDLTRGLRRERRTADKHAAAQVTQALAFLRRSRKTLPRRVRHAAGSRTAREGLTRAYRRARSASTDLATHSSADHFHRWRRRVKTHWYHMRLFERRHPAARARRRPLERLSQALGDDQNLTVLEGMLLARPDRFGARTTTLVLGCIQKRHTVLRTQALGVGRRLFAETPKEFTGRRRSNRGG